MSALTEVPLLFLPVCFGVLVLASWLGARVARARRAESEHTLDLALTATLTLLALIIGFAFSMAVGRYDMRKAYEAAEANAIGTEHARAGLLSATDAARIRRLLEAYLDERIRFYEVRSAADLGQVDTDTARLQQQLWSAVETAANGRGDAGMALVAAGMNAVLDSQGYTQAAWWNRIPGEAWELLIVIAIVAGTLFGYSAHARKATVVKVVLPLVISVAFFLIADLDSPRAGLVHVTAENLRALVGTFAPRTP